MRGLDGRIDTLEKLQKDKSKAMDEFSEPYSKAWTRVCMMKMQERLPQELRDMIYEYIWLPDEHKKLDPIIQRRCCCPARESNHVWMPQVKAYWRKPEEQKCTCFSETYGTHIMDPEFVGSEPAREIAEAWCRVKAKLRHEITIGPLETTNEAGDRLGDIVCGRLQHAGLDASMVLRALHFELDLDTLEVERPYGRMEGGPLGFKSEAERKAFFDPLYRIKKKSGFRLTVELCQWTIDLDRWEEAFNIFKPMLTRFENEGAHVLIFWQPYSGSDSVSRIDLHESIVEYNPCKAADTDEWRQSIKRRLKTMGVNLNTLASSCSTNRV
jgi:hypothetical protein